MPGMNDDMSDMPNGHRQMNGMPPMPGMSSGHFHMPGMNDDMPYMGSADFDMSPTYDMPGKGSGHFHMPGMNDDMMKTKDAFKPPKFHMGSHVCVEGQEGAKISKVLGNEKYEIDYDDGLTVGEFVEGHKLTDFMFSTCDSGLMGKKDTFQKPMFAMDKSDKKHNFD